MQVSPVKSSESFKATMPIYKILLKGADGVERELIGYTATRGPVQSFVTAINDKNSDLFQFFKKYIKDFREKPKVTSTIFDCCREAKRHLIFGEDALSVLSLRDDCYKTDNLLISDAKKIIAEKLIRPWKKKLKGKRFHGDKVGEPVGIVLHAEKQKDKYDLKFEVTNKNGRVCVSYPEIKKASEIPEIPKADTKKLEIAEHQKADSSMIATVSGKLYQPDLPGFTLLQGNL